MKVLCYFSNILGLKTWSKQFADVLNDCDGLDVKHVYFNTEDYKRYPAPRLNSFSAIAEIIWTAEKKLRMEIDPKDFDVIFVNCFEFAFAARHLFKTKKIILALDTTPVLARQLIAREHSSSFIEKIKSVVLTAVYKTIFKSTFSKVDHFFTLSNWCADSLKNDFGISEEKITVVYTSIDLDLWKPLPEKPLNPKPVLLFVGNDFKRKGGDLLLDIMRDHLKDNCILKVLSNDPHLKTIVLPASIEIKTGFTHDKIQELIYQFQTADVFVFPTRRDQLGLVLCEAMCSGLPVIATDIAAIKEVATDEFNGKLMPLSAGAGEWAEQIKLILNSPDLTLYGKNSRKKAVELFDPIKFRNKINAFFSKQ